MQVDTALKGAGFTHPGLSRDRNEDRYHYDPGRGVLVVIDGIGGQAAGGKAADTALAMLRARLERETGRIEDRLREAIAQANNEIHRLASLAADWRGMACVLTVAVVGNGEIIAGHVGDTRLYKLRRGRIEKLTHDHSPVGEREDAGELTERQAMQHPRRNEVYRDVGSEPHEPHDPEFVEILRAPFEADAALLLCSDGLTDGLTSSAIAEIVRAYAGHPHEVARALVDAANEAGGRDNVTVVYAEGPRFAMTEETRDLRGQRAPVAQSLPAAFAAAETVAPVSARIARPRRRRWITAALVVLLVAVAGVAAYLERDRLGLPDASQWTFWRATPSSQTAGPSIVRVGSGQSIAEAIALAAPGSQIIIEPGEYRDQIRLASGIHVVSRVARAATLRLPAGASETDAAITALDVSGAHLSGLRIVGDAATPLGAGVIVRNSDVTLSDLEIVGAHTVAVEFSGGGGALLSSDVHDNSGAAIVIRAGASPRVAHNAFQRNATSADAAGTLVIDADSRPVVNGNTFVGVRPDSVRVPAGDLPGLLRDNWFIETAAPAPAGRARGRR